jgi:predicted membrane channel-forming protein YqfA (hemolysin III family)
MLSYRARRRWSLVILLVGLPLFIVAAVTAMNWLDARFGRQPIWVEVLVYLALGIVWALPFRAVFRGIGQADPHDTPPR